MNAHVLLVHEGCLYLIRKIKNREVNSDSDTQKGLRDAKALVWQV